MGALERRIWWVLLAFGGVVAVGTLGYVILEGWPVLDAVYMTVITIGSVGYAEVHPLSTNGRIFTMGLIVAGLGVMGYGLSTVTAFPVEGELTDALRKRRMERKIASLRDHVILVGGGETGKHIVEEFAKTEIPFVLIERETARVASLENLIGGLRMASEMLRPHVVSLLDAMLRETGSVVRVEEIQIPAESPWIGKTLAEAQIRERVGVVIFGLREAVSGRYLFNPNPSGRLGADDVLIGCADRDQLATLRRLAAGA